MPKRQASPPPEPEFDPRALIEAVQLRVAANRQAAQQRRRLQQAQQTLALQRPLES